MEKKCLPSRICLSQELELAFELTFGDEVSPAVLFKSDLELAILVG